MTGEAIKAHGLEPAHSHGRRIVSLSDEGCLVHLYRPPWRE